MHAYQRIFIFYLLLAVASCGLMPQAKSPTDAVAITYVSIQSAADTTTKLLQAGTIDAEAAKGVQDVLERAYYLNTLAEKYATDGKPDNALSMLSMINGILSDVQSYLAKFGGV